MLPSLQELGQRIVIIGPSNSGKSTLAVYLANHLGVQPTHLDQLAHLPSLYWQRRLDQEFVDSHDDIVAHDSWIIDGNYSVCMPQRFAHATSVIWLDPPLFACIARYIKRSFINDSKRPGNLKGVREQLNFGLIKFTLFTYPKNKKKYQAILKDYPDLKVFVYKDLLRLN